jgi:hypothetical protein
MQSDQGLILCLTHSLLVLGALILEPAEMEDTMDDHTVQFFGVLVAKELGIATHRIKADEHVPRDHIPLTLVEGDDIGIVVMIEKVLIGLQDALITTELVAELADTAVIAGSDLTDPVAKDTLSEARLLDVFVSIVSYKLRFFRHK